MKNLLFIEDETGLIMTLNDRLQSSGYDVTIAQDGLEGYKLALENDYDGILLDIMLPTKNGYDICRDLRNNHIQTPILMLTARDQTIDKVVGLKIGADDYLTKPFETIELLARLEALMRRPRTVEASDESDVYQFGSVEVDFRNTQVRRNGQAIELSALEFRLLRYLIEHRNKAISRSVLLNDVWSYNATINTRTVDVHVAWLRQKVEDNPHHPQYILTIHGQGYKFVG